MKRCVTALLLLGLLLATGCVAHSLEGNPYQVYFLNQAEDGTQALRAEGRTLPAQEEVVEELLQALLAGPESENLERTIPSNVVLRGWSLSKGLLTVDFSSRYGSLSGIDLTLADYSVVLTLTQLEEVEAVMITVEGELLTYRDHQRLTPQDVQGTILGAEAQEGQE